MSQLAFLTYPRGRHIVDKTNDFERQELQYKEVAKELEESLEYIVGKSR